RERAQMRARRGEPLQCCGISGIVSPGLLDVGETGSRRDDRLIVFRQLVPFFQIEHEVIGGAALPPTRIIIVGRNLMETELLTSYGPTHSAAPMVPFSRAG